MTVFLVKTSTGEWEDTYVSIDSVWSSEEDAKKRVEILTRNDKIEEDLKVKCWNCPIYSNDGVENVNKILDAAKNYCKTYCCGKGHPYIDGKGIDSVVECEKSSVSHESVTVYSPEACDLDNTELLNDETRSSNR